MYYNRKSIRLKKYDYSQNGMYFITICAKKREPILSKIHKKTMQTPVGADALICPDAKIELKNAGKILNKYIQNVNNVYENVNINSYVIMPDHFHIIIFIDDVAIKQGSMRASTPTNKITISKIIRGIKSLTTREIGYSIVATWIL